MTTKPDSSKMEYRYLGPTGLRVSVVSWGNWVNNSSDKLTVDSVKFCLEHGINFFDTAEVLVSVQLKYPSVKHLKNWVFKEKKLSFLQKSLNVD